MKIKKLLFVSILLLSTALNAQAPSPVTDLLASNTTETTTDLTWSTPSGTITEYKIFKDAVQIATTTNTFYNVTGLTIDTSYNFTVFAFNLTEGSTVSNTEVVVTSDVTLPSTVTNLVYAGITAGFGDDELVVTLTWDAATDNVGVTEYYVDASYYGGEFTTFGTPVTNSYDATMYVGDNADFRVYAVDAAGNSSALPSNTVNVIGIDIYAPDNVTNLAASNTTATTTDLTWDAATDNVAVTGYEVYQNTNSGGDVLVASPATNSATIGSLVIGDSNDFTVFAKDAAGNSSALASNTVNVITADIMAPVTIADLAASNITETTADLTWSTTDNVGVTDYEVFQDVTGAGSPVSLGLTGGTASMNVTGLVLGTSYDFTVYAQDAANNVSQISNTAVVVTVDVTPPSNVINLAATNTTATTTDLTWDAASDNVAVTGYEVYQNTNSGGDVLVASPATNSATIGSLVIGDSNDFTVFAKDAAGNSSALASNTVNVITADTTPPVTIADLAASNITETTADLTWSTTDNVGVTDYEVFQDVTGVGTPVSLGLTGGTASMNVTGLVLGTSYDFTVYAQDAAGNVSQVSNTAVVVTVDVTPPSNVINLAATNTTETTTDLTWDAASDNVAVTGYEVYQNTNSGGDALVASPATNSATIGSLVIGDSNDFTVFAKDAAGNSSALASNTVNVVTADITAPVTIADLAASNITETTADLTWSTTDNVGVTDYEVFQDVTGVGTPVSLGLTGGTASMNVTGLVLGTSYDFTVYAQDAANNVSQISNTAVVVTVDTTPPAAIDDLTSSNITFASATLSWSQVTDNVAVVNYEIFQDDVSIGFSGGFSTYDVGGLAELTIYRFKVTAIDAAGNSSSLSNVEIVETPKENQATNYNSDNVNLISADWTARDLFAVGNVGIGTFPSASYKLAVNGNVIAEEVRVALKANWPDYVFEDSYHLEPLNKVEEFINEYGHLKNIPDALTAKSNGISLGEMNSLLLRKIEELTLYTIQQEKKINAISKENDQLQSLNERLQKVEKLVEQLKK